MRRARLIITSLLATVALLVGSVVFAQDAATIDLSGHPQVVYASVAPMKAYLPERPRFWP